MEFTLYRFWLAVRVEDALELLDINDFLLFVWRFFLFFGIFIPVFACNSFVFIFSTPYKIWQSLKIVCILVY